MAHGGQWWQWVQTGPLSGQWQAIGPVAQGIPQPQSVDLLGLEVPVTSVPQPVAQTQWAMPLPVAQPQAPWHQPQASVPQPVPQAQVPQAQVPQAPVCQAVPPGQWAQPVAQAVPMPQPMAQAMPMPQGPAQGFDPLASAAASGSSGSDPWAVPQPMVKQQAMPMPQKCPMPGMPKPVPEAQPQPQAQPVPQAEPHSWAPLESKPAPWQQSTGVPQAPCQCSEWLNVHCVMFTVSSCACHAPCHAHCTWQAQPQPQPQPQTPRAEPQPQTSGQEWLGSGQFSWPDEVEARLALATINAHDATEVAMEQLEEVALRHRALLQWVDRALEDSRCTLAQRTLLEQVRPMILRTAHFECGHIFFGHCHVDDHWVGMSIGLANDVCVCVYVCACVCVSVCLCVCVSVCAWPQEH
jgi:hypothetical protein